MFQQLMFLVQSMALMKVPYLLHNLLMHLFMYITFRSSRLEMFLVKCVINICSKFRGEHTCCSLISIKLLRKFFEITLRHVCSPLNLLHIFRTPFTKTASGWLHLNIRSFFNVWYNISVLTS